MERLQQNQQYLPYTSMSYGYAEAPIDGGSTHGQTSSVSNPESYYAADSPYSITSSRSSLSPRSAQSPTMSNNGASGGNSDVFTCLWPGCDGGFKRYTDLERHYSTVHRQGELIDCKYGWCGRTGDRGFSRKDHYRDHLREVHREDIPKSKNKNS